MSAQETMTQTARISEGWTRQRGVFRDICRTVLERDAFLLTSHARPDGDSIGSQLAMAFALDALGKRNEPLLELAMELERVALEDDYFVERKLYPNVDFYSGIILQAIGFPTSMFTALFALARTVGWVAQWKEMIEDPSQRIGRPRQLYTGSPQRRYLPIDQRR